jgi:hypothetical protein
VSMRSESVCLQQHGRPKVLASCDQHAGTCRAIIRTLKEKFTGILQSAKKTQLAAVVKSRPSTAGKPQPLLHPSFSIATSLKKELILKPIIALLGLCLATVAHAQSLTLNQIFAFTCQTGLNDTCPDGARPSTLLQASDGNFYGITETSLDSHGFTQHPMGGTVFKLTASGQLTLLYTFKQNTKTGFYTQGYFPTALAEGSDGFLYGTTGTGGAEAQRERRTKERRVIVMPRARLGVSIM